MSDRSVVDGRARIIAWLAGLAIIALIAAWPARWATAAEAASPDLRELVAPIAFYPDDLLALVLPAATVPLDVVAAARYLRSEDAATTQPEAGWDPAVVALLNYPEALNLLDADLDWTQRLGEAVSADLQSVLTTIQTIRSEAVDAGYLTTTDQVAVAADAGTVTIVSATPNTVYVPVYEPATIVTASYASAPPIAYPAPYPTWNSPAATFFAGALFGGAMSYAFNWGDDDIDFHYDDNPNWGDFDVDQNFEWNGDVNINRNIERNNFANIDRDSVRVRADQANLIGPGRGDGAWRPGAGDRPRPRPAVDPDRVRQGFEGLAPTPRPGGDRRRERAGDAGGRGDSALRPGGSRRDADRARDRGRDSIGDRGRDRGADRGDRPRRPSAGSGGRRDRGDVSGGGGRGRSFGGGGGGRERARSSGGRGRESRGGGGGRRRRG